MRDMVLVWLDNPRAAGQRLRRFRQEAGLRQRDLAARTGLAITTIRRIERGHRVPHEETIELLAQGLGLSPDAFVADLRASSPFAPHPASERGSERTTGSEGGASSLNHDGSAADWPA